MPVDMKPSPRPPTAFAFPGAGIQASGYEPAFLDAHRSVLRPRLDRASALVGVDLRAAVSGGFESLPDLPRQAFTYAYGAGMAEVLRSQGDVPAVVAGHSLGVYAASVASGAIGFEDGLTLVEVAWRAAVRACAGRGVGMAAVAGLDEAEIAGLPGVDGETVRVVLVNAPGSVVLAGPLEGLEASLEAALTAGAARAAWVDREVAYHHPLYMAGASADLLDVASSLAWGEPAIPVASTIDGRILRSLDDIRTFVAANLSTPIAWPLAIAAFASLGVANVSECGPGLTLTRLARFLEPEMTWRNVRRLVKAEA